MARPIHPRTAQELERLGHPYVVPALAGTAIARVPLTTLLQKALGS
ncbi:hypothetical protein [Falsiroseomonas sp.]